MPKPAKLTDDERKALLEEAISLRSIADHRINIARSQEIEANRNYVTAAIMTQEAQEKEDRAKGIWCRAPGGQTNQASHRVYSRHDGTCAFCGAK